MERFQSLIATRVYEVISLISTIFPEASGSELYRHLDVDQTVDEKQLNYRLNLPTHKLFW